MLTAPLSCSESDLCIAVDRQVVPIGVQYHSLSFRVSKVRRVDEELPCRPIAGHAYGLAVLERIIDDGGRAERFLRQGGGVR